MAAGRGDAAGIHVESRLQFGEPSLLKAGGRRALELAMRPVLRVGAPILHDAVKVALFCRHLQRMVDGKA